MKRSIDQGGYRVRWPAMMAVLACLLAPARGYAQPTASPAGPMDLTKPQFDTQTPQYDVSDATQKASKTVVAEVDGRAITLGQVGDTIRDLPPSERQRPFDELYPLVLQKLIIRQAMVIRAHGKGMDEEPAVRRQIQADSDRVLSEVYAERETAARISDETLRAKYHDEIAGKPGPEEVRFLTMSVKTEQEAQGLIKELQNGADFATLAHRSSIDPSEAIGGEVPFTPRDGLTPEVGAVAFALAPGQLAPYPVRSNGVWFVVKLEERRSGPTPSFQAVRQKLLLTLQKQAFPAVAQEAVAQSTVREYAITGKETAGDQ